MSGPKKNNNPADDLMTALLKEIGEVDVAAEPVAHSDENPEGHPDENSNEPLELLDLGNGNDKTVIEPRSKLSNKSFEADFDSKTNMGYDSTLVFKPKTQVTANSTQLTQFENLKKDVAPPTLRKQDEPQHLDEGQHHEVAYDMPDEILDEPVPNVIDRTEIQPAHTMMQNFEPIHEPAVEKPESKPVDSLFGPSSEELPITYLNHEETVARVAAMKNGAQPQNEISNETVALQSTLAIAKSNVTEENDRTVALHKAEPVRQATSTTESERTIAVTGFKQREIENHDDKVKVAIGQNRPAYSSGYASWGGGSDVSLGHAENLRIAQEKILDLEKENEKLRIQNEELLSASEIIKERSDLLTAQVSEYKNDRDGLEESFKNEIALLKGHLHRKDVENQKAQIKIDDLDSRLKFDMKKIRIRERELENRLELVRAEKNALMKSKDEQILDLRRKMDVLQMEVDSYRQKCVELNKSLEVNQDSFKRTTRALRLAMANLELQEENKISFKKVD